MENTPGAARHTACTSAADAAVPPRTAARSAVAKAYLPLSLSCLTRPKCLVLRVSSVLLLVDAHRRDHKSGLDHPQIPRTSQFRSGLALLPAEAEDGRRDGAGYQVDGKDAQPARDVHDEVAALHDRRR